MLRPGRFTLGKKPSTIVYEEGWAPGPVWMGEENLVSTGIQSADLESQSSGTGFANFDHEIVG